MYTLNTLANLLWSCLNNPHTNYRGCVRWKTTHGEGGLLKLNITMVRAGYFQTRMQGLCVFFSLGDERNSWGFINKDTFKAVLTAPRKILLYFQLLTASVPHKRPQDFTTDKLELPRPRQWWTQWADAFPNWCKWEEVLNIQRANWSWCVDIYWCAKVRAGWLISCNVPFFNRPAYSDH